jgi:electron transport complex protein RnfD
MQISPPPYIRSGMSVQKRMSLTLIGLLPIAATAVYVFGWRALFIMITSVATAMLMDYLVKRMRGRPYVLDGSAPLVGLLLALTLPLTIDLWMVVVGAIFAIGVVKEAFGGLGHYIFSPVMAGRVFLEVSFWTKMSFGDAETPLSQSFALAGTKLELYRAMFFGDTAGSIGETGALYIIVGGLVLIALRIIDWKIPVSFIGTVALLSLILLLVNNDAAELVRHDVLVQILGGGLILAAFFIATDTVTLPVTRRGRIIFGICCGLFTFIIREWGDAREGVYYAVLLMNSVVPLIDRFIKTRPFGLQKEAESTVA